VGYDMHIVNTPEPLAENDRKCDEILHQPPTDETRAAYRALLEERWRLQEEYGSYFRLNIFGMGQYRGAMEEIGMLAWCGEPRWPELADFGVPITKTTYNGREYVEPDEGSLEYAAYKAACDEVLAWTDTTVIAGHKLCSNDGWIVTPMEIARALDRWYEWKREHAITELLDDEDYWNKWIAFLETAVKGGGFKVY
jgi:hypothetical protein